MSQREIPVELVLDACNKWKDRREKRIEREREEAIQRIMAKRKLFFGSYYTREEAIHYLKHDDQYMSTWRSIAWTGSKWAYKVDELIELCKAPGRETMFIDAEMANIIF